jgi:hypothetical protein
LPIALLPIALLLALFSFNTFFLTDATFGLLPFSSDLPLAMILKNKLFLKLSACFALLSTRTFWGKQVTNFA